MSMQLYSVFTTGKEKGVKITQIFPEAGILGLVLPNDLSKWTTEQVRNGRCCL